MASVVKVQRGITTITNANVDVTIDEVDLSKALLLFSASCNQVLMSAVTGHLLDETTIRFSNDSDGQNQLRTISWEVVEFGEGVTVQRGVMDATVSPEDTLASSVNLNRSFLVPGGFFIVENNATDDRCGGLYLSDEDTVSWAGPVAGPRDGSDIMRPWQVVEFDSDDDIFVQRGELVIGNGETEGVAELSTPVTIENCVVILQLIKSNQQAGSRWFPDSDFARVVFNSTTEIEGQRAVSAFSGSTPEQGVSRYRYEVVEFKTALVQEIAASLGTSDTQDSVEVEEVDPEIAFIIPQGWWAKGGGMGFSTAPEFDDFGSSVARFILEDETTVSAIRSTALDGAGNANTLDVHAYLVQLAAGGGAGGLAFSSGPTVDQVTATSARIRATATNE